MGKKKILKAFKKHGERTPVRILPFDRNTPDSEGHVIRVSETGVFVANMNMPYCGSYSNEFFPFDRVELDL